MSVYSCSPVEIHAREQLERDVPRSGHLAALGVELQSKLLKDRENLRYHGRINFNVGLTD
jgi:hypothetical protein